jgi:regulator of PEP synthase PpsR (kinase-PPPase family)
LGDPKRADRAPAGLGGEYFALMDAIEYTRKSDDGAAPSRWKDADLLILGVSRCGKTPLSFYLGQRGFKVLGDGEACLARVWASPIM